MKPDDHRTAGQATVELALAMPVVFVLLLGVVQLAVVVRNQLGAIEAARVAARAAVVSPDPAAAANSVGTSALSIPTRISTAVANGRVRVTVVVPTKTDIPLIGMLIPDLELTAQATMTLEPP